ncbi:MAG: tRNA (adenosine(37)-N6)-threonylcarbamoyltransferase complex transferase subunit TsaD [Armatimonadetes bacterium]|nr:tRNA (adenosine(37)-N6)-threonylcarbamoyltransferase complex transferase subunit TsaD [Armatimonadota bacterium]NIO74850.1 tRNA (adenosine(37)-N6)-threonylcarbamoyltransferase complex transferase subunit TsaD [Armatimonadota bacterium]NIO95612.1 tRNA (adenosine(37)-N6)-threonylcarbamoyltransferase complex transferase subunit TsaD [Armatimonadota bacterium]
MADKELLLAIETSCDETAAALVKVEAGRLRLVSNVVATQHEFHERFGGIVPEIAARRHAEVLQAIIAEALERAGAGFADLNAVAVVNGPGLIGSLVVGVAAAKAIALAREIPLIGVNHLEAHIYSAFLPEAGEPPNFPLLALIASGGHTHLVLMSEHGRFEVVGRTRDDAAGEAFDKAGKLLGLEYPGGPALAALADSTKETGVEFPIADIQPPKPPQRAWDFSFSGTKTALARHVRELSVEQVEKQKTALAAGFQSAVVRALVERTFSAAEELEVESLVVVGGVACNQRLRDELSARAREVRIGLHIPPPWLCTDNAAMVASAAYHKVTAKTSAGAGTPALQVPPDRLDLDCDSSLPLRSWG